MLMNTQEYLSAIENIKQEIKTAQYRATVHANSDLPPVFLTEKLCKRCLHKLHGIIMLR